jgi:hypothetical protein
MLVGLIMSFFWVLGASQMMGKQHTSVMAFVGTTTAAATTTSSFRCRRVMAMTTQRSSRVSSMMMQRNIHTTPNDDVTPHKFIHRPNHFLSPPLSRSSAFLSPLSVSLSTTPATITFRLYSSTTSSVNEDSAAASSSASDHDATALDELNERIKGKGEEIRQLKADGVDKQGLAPYVAELLALKAQLPTTDNAVSPPTTVTTTTSTTDTTSTTNEKKKTTNGKSTNKQQKQPSGTTSPSVEIELPESEIKLNRLAKVKAMRDAGVEPFEYSFSGTTSAAQLNVMYDGKLQPGEEDEESDVAVAGRIMTRRVFGKLAFFTMQDESGITQLQFDTKRLEDSFQVRIII